MVGKSLFEFARVYTPIPDINCWKVPKPVSAWPFCQLFSPKMLCFAES